MDTTTNLFEVAARTKLRIQTKRGTVTAEDLWDLPLTELDEAYKLLVRELRDSSEDSLLARRDRSASACEARLKRDIIQYVVETRQAEADAKTAAVARKQEAERIRGLLAQKQDDALKNMSAEELQKRLAELDG